MITEKLQWHPAFNAALRIELEENLDDLIFKEEYQLSKKPMQMDILVIKKNVHAAIKKNIGHIFRTHNIIEYKSPDDSLSINDFYKVYGYTCFYQSDTERILQIDPEEISITFVCRHYPRKMIQHLKDVRGMTIEKYGKGIYYLHGDPFPMQIVITTQLSQELNYWLQHLRNDINSNEIQDLIANYEPKKYSKNYQAVMDLIVRANWDTMKEAQENMCDALRELFADELEKSKKAAMEQGLEQGLEQGIELKLIQQISKKLAKGKQPKAIADDLEEDLSTVEKICRIAVRFAPDYNCDLIYEQLNVSHK